MKHISDYNLENKTVLLRADLNVPRNDHGAVSDTTRIDRIKPTIDALKAAKAKIVILSHFGRPKGEADPKFSLNFLPAVLEKQWKTPVSFSEEAIGEKAKSAISSLNPGDIILLENVRFYAGETKNDQAFISQLAELGDIYINDAFSASHRAHASTEGLAKALPSAAGLLMAEELNALSQALEAPEKPVAAIVGGAKVSTKLDVLKNLSAKVDYLILGGGMANTFILAQGGDIGNSLAEADMVDTALEIMEYAKSQNCELVLPTDTIVTEDFKPHAESKIVPINQIPSEMGTMDMGPESCEHVKSIIAKCKTLLWNGPAGVFELKPFDKGTNALAQFAAECTKAGDLVSIAGGGDTVAALENAGVKADFTYVSTAGGAFLEWLEGKDLPGVAALKQQAMAA